MPFRTRKEQIEKDVFPRLQRELKAKGVILPADAKPVILAAFESAVMIGGCELRRQALDEIRGSGDRDVYNRITQRGVLDVLGYDEETPAGTAVA